MSPQDKEVTATEEPSREPSTWFVVGGLGCMVLGIIGIFLMIAGVVYTQNVVKKMEQRYRDLGYQKQIQLKEQELTEDLKEPTMISANLMKVSTDVSHNIAILSPRVEIFKHCKGEVRIGSDTFIVHPGAVIDGLMDVEAREVEIHGTLNGPVHFRVRKLTIGKTGIIREPLEGEIGELLNLGRVPEIKASVERVH